MTAFTKQAARPNDTLVLLRAAVLREYDAYCESTKCGPCGAIAVALSRMGFGKVARVYAISTEEREDCDLSEDCARPIEGLAGRFYLQHFAVLDSRGDIFDIALPPDFMLRCYEIICSFEDNDSETETDLWEEEDFSFWQAVLSRALLEQGTV